MDDNAAMATGPELGGEDGSRLTTLLAASHLLRISASWLGLTGVLLATFAVQAGSLPIALIAVAVVELATMASVVLRVARTAAWSA